MDDKGSLRRKSDASRRRRTRVKIDKRMVWKFLSTHKNTLITSLLLILITCLLFGVFSQFQAPVTSAAPGGVTEVTYSAFIQQVKAGNVQAVAIQGEGINSLLIHPLITSSNATGSGQTDNQATTPTNTPNSVADADYLSWLHYVGASGTSSLSGPTIPPVVNAGRAIYTHALPSGDAALLPLLHSTHIIVDTLAPASPSPWLSLFLRFMPVLLLVVLLLVFLYARRNANTSRSMDDRVTQIGKSRARRFVRTREGSAPANEARSTRHTGVGRPTSPTTPARAQGARSTTIRVSTEPQVTFADVAGIDEVRVDLEEIVQFLRQPERFDKLGAHIPRGALLVGPPGTGKTLLAKAVAGEAHVPFFSMSASEFVEMFVGVGASRVRDLFQQARQAAPSVIFIDEIDAVGRKRSARMGNDERDQTLNQLLVELDGFDARHAVVVMAATNRADILDKALLRPGRFDRHITVSPPDRVGREAILKVHTRNTPLHEEISLERLARMTTGMTGADLANLVNEAALTAARRDMEHLTHDCFEDALARVQLGALRPLVMSERERRIIAYHEGGHALVAHYLPEADRVNRVTILPRGQSLGVTQFTAEEDRYNYSRETLMARIAVGLGGRVAEELTFGHKHITTGAENDFQVVTSLARRMVTRWGMSEQFGVVFADSASEGDYSLNMRRSDPADLPSYTRALLLDANGQPVLDDDDPLPARTHQFAMTAPRNSNGVMLNALIDAEVQRILQEGQEIARTLLLKHSKQLALLADTLMEREQLDRTQFEMLVQGE